MLLCLCGLGGDNEFWRTLRVQASVKLLKRLTPQVSRLGSSIDSNSSALLTAGGDGHRGSWGHRQSHRQEIEHPLQHDEAIPGERALSGPLGLSVPVVHRMMLCKVVLGSEPGQVVFLSNLLIVNVLFSLLFYLLHVV